MPKVWLQQQWETLIPALEALGVDQEPEIERLCVEAIRYWREDRKMSLSSMRVPMTDTRNRLKQIPLTPANRWKNPQTGDYEHIARKYMNFSQEEWNAINEPTKEDVQDRQEHQQLIENPAAIVAKAERLLSSDRWYDLVAGLALVTGRRLTEVLKTARFFPCTLYSVTFDGQLKKREDVNLLPYEIPTLVRAELVIAAWRRLRALVDTTKLDNSQVAEKYHKDASEAANRHFAGLIPQQSEKENLSTKAFRAVYAHIAVLWFCPLRTSDRSYANAILGHWQAKDEKTKRHFLATEHYFDYVMSLDGQIDGRRGIRLDEPGIEVLSIYKQQQGDAAMTSTDQLTTQDDEQTQDEQQALETKPAKKRGTLTTKPGTFDIVVARMRERGYQKHDEIVVNLLEGDSIAHQAHSLLEPLAEQLGPVEGTIAMLQALIAAYQGGNAPALPGLSELLQGLVSQPLTIKTGEKPNEVEINSKENPVGYLTALVERDRKFKAGIDRRYSSEIDYSTYAWADLDGHKTKDPAAATERYRRAVDAIIAHNRATSDPLHRWYINAAIVRDLVGGRNDKVQAYLATRAAEIDAHHKEFNPPLNVKQNNKNMEIKDEYGPDGWAFMK
jgi:hypothetical protein